MAAEVPKAQRIVSANRRLHVMDNARRQNGGDSAQTATPTNSPTNTASSTPTLSPTQTPTATLTPSSTRTSTMTLNPTPTRTVTLTPTETQALACIGDCNGDHDITVDQLLTLVNIALGDATPSTCAQGVPSGASVDVALIIQAVTNALRGCAG